MNSFIKSLAIALAWFAGSSLATAASVTLPAIYADHMVIQMGQPIVLTGTVLPTRDVTVEVAGQSVTVKPELFGSWTATLPPVNEAGGSHTLTVSVEGEIAHSLENVTFGDVWLCGGQSNMDFDMTTINNSGAEIAAANFPDIRLMEVALHTESKPKDKLARFMQRWTPCSPAAVRGFSGVGFLFGREIHQETGRPIGLIQSAWGGSRIETWIPDAALQGSPYADNVSGRNFGQAQHQPSICYNGMIHGLRDVALKGVIWYQGENNQTHPQEYRSLHETLISSWRELWQSPELPFYYVQLANYRPGTRWELLREAQTQVLAIPHTGMAVTIDIGNSSDIHPRNKQGTAHRLAAIALAKTYGQDRVYSGPRFRSAHRDGAKITLTFDHLGSGLVAMDGGTTLSGFETKSSEGNWGRAPARIDGDTVVLPGSIFRPNPQGVRYAWHSDPVVSLANKEGFPAAPFRLEALETTYATWQDQLVGERRLPDEDANGNGLSNLAEYARAGKPLSLTKNIDGGRELKVHRRATAADVIVAFEQSVDLINWTETWSNVAPDRSGVRWTQDFAWGNVMTDQYTLTLPIDEAPATYYRTRYQLATAEE